MYELAIEMRRRKSYQLFKVFMREIVVGIRMCKPYQLFKVQMREIAECAYTIPLTKQHAFQCHMRKTPHATEPHVIRDML